MSDDLICEQCQRTISIDEPFEQAPGITVPVGSLIQHKACPPGTCASCNTERPYAELRVANLGGEGEDDPDMLACIDVYACQVRAGEIDPDDVPGAGR
jgi:hypothetical protein